MTEELYDIDPRMGSFSAKVLSCEAEEDHYLVVLDRTAFFPEQGGQYADRGTLCGEICVQVLDARIREGVITHVVSGPLSVGSSVKGEVDMADRFDKMQQHTGEHIFSGLVHSTFGFNNVGFHLGPEHMTMDFDGVFDWEQMKAIEQRANEAVWQNLPVEVTYPDTAALQTLDYRSKKELEGAVRIVTIPGVDVCACCAPHVARTGEIGLIKIASLEKYKGGVRVTMLCGKRALMAVEQWQDTLNQAAVDLSVKTAEVPEALHRLQQELLNRGLQLKEAKEKILAGRIAGLSDNTTNPLIFENGLDEKVMQHAVNDLKERFSGYCGVFNGTEGNYRFVIGSGSKDCRIIAKQLREELQARGGGQPTMIQGSIAKDADTIAAFWSTLED